MIDKIKPKIVKMFKSGFCIRRVVRRHCAMSYCPECGSMNLNIKYAYTENGNAFCKDCGYFPIFLK
jgi:hypothetical protein